MPSHGAATSGDEAGAHQPLAIYGTGRRLHQMAVLEQRHGGWLPTMVSSPDADEDIAVKARYMEPIAASHATSPALLATHLIDSHVAAVGADPTRRVILVPPVSVLTLGALSQLRRHARAGTVHVVPPTRIVPSPTPVLVHESVSRAALSATSFMGRSLLEVLLDRAVWAMAVASWSVNTNLAGGIAISLLPPGSTVCMHAMPVVGLFGIGADGPSECLSLVTADGGKSSCPCHRVENDLFLRAAVRCGWQPDADSARFASHYLDALFHTMSRNSVERVVGVMR